MMRAFVIVILCLLAPACAAGDTLKIVRDGDVVTKVKIDLAETEAERQTGLMRVKYMPADRGMLFIFPKQRLITMWMRNTYIPLDMIFAQCDGTISHIHENAVPHDETLISSKGLARVVLEVNGGFAAHHGIKAGDRLKHKRLDGEGCKP